MTTPDPSVHPEVLVACRRGNDKLTAGQSCDSKRAYRLTGESSQAPAFKCVKCGFEWVIPIGGQFTY